MPCGITAKACGPGKLRMLSPWSLRVSSRCKPAAKAWHPPRRALPSCGSENRNRPRLFLQINLQLLHGDPVVELRDLHEVARLRQEHDAFLQGEVAAEHRAVVVEHVLQGDAAERAGVAVLEDLGGDLGGGFAAAKDRAEVEVVVAFESGNAQALAERRQRLRLAAVEPGGGAEELAAGTGQHVARRLMRVVRLGGG